MGTGRQKKAVGTFCPYIFYGRGDCNYSTWEYGLIDDCLDRHGPPSRGSKRAVQKAIPATEDVGKYRKAPHGVPEHAAPVQRASMTPEGFCSFGKGCGRPEKRKMRLAGPRTKRHNTFLTQWPRPNLERNA